MTEKVVGLDGCKDGWIAAVVIDRKLREIEFHKSAQAALEAHCDAEVFAFDIPIGLSTCGRRESDVEARKFLSSTTKRTRSVFNAPPRSVIGIEDYDEAKQRTKGVSGGPGLSKQSFGLFRKIREVRDLEDKSKVYEAHPETTFAKLAGNQPLPSKKTWSGLKRRIALLCGEGLAVLDVEDRSCNKATPDDVVDAVACAWTAGRIAKGKACTFPDPPQCIDGCEVAIWC